MKIVDFEKALIDQARDLIRSNYLEERAVVAALPAEPEIPSLEGLAKNGLSVAAVEDGKLLGFLGAYGPWKPVFCTPDVSGVFSPLHAHDAEAKEALYLYGFGVRCMDFIRPVKSLGIASVWQCSELPSSRYGELTPLRRELANHLAQSPSFMQHDPKQLEAWLKRKEAVRPRVFVAESDGKIAAYMEADTNGENYVSHTSGTMSICGAYCLPEYRGTGAAQAVLEHMLCTFRMEGFNLLGVDCESFNPTALGFWRKYFDAYTYSVVRRIDENTIK